MVVCKKVDNKDFLWDGNEYASHEEALQRKNTYEKEGFETYLIEVDGKHQLFTRRVVTEVIVDGAPS